MAELPTGTVTFVFTDIEGSTRLARQLRSAWGGVLAHHQMLLREAFRSHGGHEVDTQGDSFFYAFGSAREAMLAATTAQRAIESADWPEGARLRVRIGMHTGQASPTDGRYVGVAVHRAARICAAAHGGQVLVSETTRELLEDEDVEFRDLGEQRLKDLDRPVHLHQLAAPGLEARFPAPRTERKSRRLTVVLGAGAVVAAAAALVVVFTGDSAAPVAVLPNSVAVVDPNTNEVAASIAVGESPGPIAAGEEEGLWVFNRNDGTISKLDPVSRVVEDTRAVVTSQQPPVHLLTVGEGWVWVGHALSLQVVNPSTGQPFHTARLSRSADDFWLDVAHGLGAIWATNNLRELARINPQSFAVDRIVRLDEPPKEFFAGSSVAVGGAAVWVAHYERGGVGLLFRYEPDTGRISRIDLGGQPTAIAVGEGAVWVTDAERNEVIRIRASTATVEKRIPVGREPSGAAVGLGAVWVVNSGEGTVSRIDTDSNRVVATIELGHRPEAVVVAEGAVWVTVREG